MSYRFQSWMCAALTPISLIGILSTPAASQVVDAHMWAPDGYVTAVLRSGNTIYIGGHFTYVGPVTGGGVALDATAGTGVSSSVNGVIEAVAPDGSGGWYIGGSFSSVHGAPRQNLARVLADGSLSAWDPGANGDVRALAASGSTVYAGGWFTSIAGQSRSRIAALDASTGMATGWSPAADGVVLAVAVSGSTVYVGGFFRTSGASQGAVSQAKTGG
jgi:hypothetical protein